ncbi:MAG: hydrogenase formation protein HypD [Desulfobacterales bacterium]|jgi:hydrogenase expression/formation protein HypD|nr:hydrogenase formation protein HypD [Desulfobacteraceae bacterium]MBT7084892.1 hydrogenase formation protein HypD [Desulfobacterales bacterium]MBT7698456.1 hydrogenase formation protein HypD [Desulfobacterales bacterium]
MTNRYIKEYRDDSLSRKIIDGIKATSKKKIKLMEVCGTHTVSIFRSGIRSVLPENISLLSGPGCPVCVTDQREIDIFIQLSKRDDVIVATFGDLMKVPGTDSSLIKERANGKDIRIVYSAMDAVEIAKKTPDKNVVFFGVGFETTAPTIAASILTAEKEGIKNFYVFSAHKLVPPALNALMNMDGVNIDGFILPGHVSVVIGTNAYRQFFNEFRIPCAIAGFEPADILQGILALIEQIESQKPYLVNTYKRVVSSDGNKKAMQIMLDVFDITDASWRGIGLIPESGLRIKEKFKEYNAEEKFVFSIPASQPIKGCECGKILTGLITPPECPLYKKTCTPEDPVGPCMVSTEGTCAAFYRYSS